MTDDRPTRVVICDDHDIVRRGLCSILQDYPEIEVVGQASNVHEALELVRQEKPDILLLDIRMDEINGLDAIPYVRAAHAATKIIMLTMYTDEAFFFRALRAGAKGYFLKGSSSRELVSAIQAVLEGGTYLTPRLADILVSHYLQLTRSQGKPG